jgi:uncharacterized membrane protein HdeD (DUF308 family)
MLMVSALKANWWMLVLRGIVAIAFGIVSFIWPQVTVLALVFLLAAFAFVEGIFAFAGAFGYGLPGGQRLLLILLGLLGVAVGVVAVARPGLAALTILVWVAWWAIIAGVIQIVVAIEMRKEIENEWALIIGALLCILFGVLLLWRPFPGIITLAYLFGFYAIIFGIAMLSLGVRLRSLATRAAG